MINYIIVSVGAAIGGAARYWVSNLVYKFVPVTFPYGTLAVNVIGSFILGLVIFRFCGGFTTFSTFSLETFNLIKNAEYILAAMNIIFSLFFCVAGIFLAYIVSKII